MWPSSGNTQVGRNMYRIVNSENNKKKVCYGRITSMHLTYYHNVDISSKVILYDLISQKTAFFFQVGEVPIHNAVMVACSQYFCLITRKSLSVTKKNAQHTKCPLYFTTSVANILHLNIYLRRCTRGTFDILHNRIHFLTYSFRYLFRLESKLY
jgi:hypothetical protein